MKKLNRIFGPIPSRRLGRSLGISPIPKKVCNYSCIYCQLGRTDAMTNTRKSYYKVKNIIEELKEYLEETEDFDIITLVGEGEPTLYLDLEELLIEIKKITEKPVAVITNGALIYDENVQKALMQADIILPSLDAYNEKLYKKIDRPFGNLNFKREIDSLIEFSKIYKGQIWLEIMLVHGYNSSPMDIDNFAELLKNIRYDKIFINTPVRPPAESFVEMATEEELEYASKKLKAISIEKLSSGNFFSDIKDNYEAILNIIKRHPMTQFEIKSFLESRKANNPDEIFERLNLDKKVNHINYKGIYTYRLK